MSSDNKSDWMLIAIPGVIWGASFLFIAEGLRSVGPMGVTLIRIAIGFAAVTCFRAAWKQIDRRDWPAIVWLGILWMAFPLALFPFAEQRISSAIAGMLNGAVPLSAAVIASIIARRLPARRVLAGLAVGLAGVVLMAIPDMGDPSSAAAVMMVLVACVSYGFAPNIARPLQVKYGALPVIWRAQAVALLITLPLGFSDVVHARWSWIPALSLLALGALGTGVAHVVMTTASGKLGATRASATAFLIPPVALLLGVMLRGEHVALLAVVGGAACVAGAWIMRRATADSGSRGTAALRSATASASLLLVMVLPVVAMLLVPTTVSAQQPADVIPLTRLRGPIVLDGRSDDAAWQAVQPVELAVHLPTYGSAPTERTVARIAYDDDALYVVVDAFEAHAGGVRASSMIRDDDAPGDFINLTLDTFGDRQNGVSFSTTPGGQRNDWSISNDARDGSSLSPGWNAVWDLATTRDPNGWHAEFRIPFSTLRFTTTDGRVEFGLSLNRLTAHSNERVTYPNIEPSAPMALWKPSRWQRVSVDNISPARSVRFVPYAVAGIAGARAPDPAASPWARDDVSEVGGDLKIAVTPYVTLDLTANTDFAEAEVDDQRVNLTRFPLLYPERRLFFVERAGTFVVRTGDTDLLFNSRRVGLTPLGQPVRLLGGARLVGQVSGWDFGFFDAQMEGTQERPGENLGVLRVRRSVVNERSWVGMMLTSRIATDSIQTAIGTDGELFLGGDDYVSYSAAVLAGQAGSGPSGGVLPRGALRLSLERRRNRDFWYRVGVSTTGADYAPALGYVERTNAIRPAAEVGYGRLISQAGHVVRTSVVTSGAWRNSDESFEGSHAAAIVALENPNGGVWTLTGARQDDDLVLPFSPTPGTTVPVGRHTATYAELALTPSTGPRAVLGGSLRVGEFFDGSLRSLTLSPEWRASAHLRVSAELQVAKLEFPTRGQDEWSQLARIRVLAAATPRLSLIAVVQANALANLATGNVRLRYNVREGDDLWVVYGQQENLDRDRMSPRVPGTASAGLLIKFTRSFGQ